jgi:hypothetical protein
MVICNILLKGSFLRTCVAGFPAGQFYDSFMDIQVDFFRWQVPDLKEYLQHRGITCHLHRKHELVKLCELAQEFSKDWCCVPWCKSDGRKRGK